VNSIAMTIPATLTSNDNGTWHGGPWPWWPIFPLLWLLVVFSAIALFGWFGRRRWRQMGAQSGRRAGEARLAERYASGEIDEREYEQRLATLQRLSPQ
jgi:putative membrane protein